MSLQLHNTMKRKKEPFVPITPNEAKVYVCGPTVYDDCHVGHARCYVVFDTLVRYLRYIGYKVTYVRNVTDLEDKIIDRAREEGITFTELAQRYTDAFHRDLDALGLLRPEHEPRPTEYIQGMLDDIQGLFDAGCAYQSGDDVYYDVSSFEDYGALSGRNLEDMKAGARVEVDANKRSPFDFVLWKAGKPGEPSWDSPWGAGRPGWHLECSTMSAHFLGGRFDIHGGGSDLIFPHHENEIAQSVPLGREFVRYWLHNGFVRINQQKMSKSLKNFFTIREVLTKFHPEVLRLFVLSNHYRSPIDFSDEAMIETAKGLDRAYRALKQAADSAGHKPDDTAIIDPEILARFKDAMDDDLNTARAIGHIFEAVRELNRLQDGHNSGQVESTRIQTIYNTILEMGQVLGIFTRAPDQYFTEKNSLNLSDSTVTPEKIEEMIAARTKARTNKDWVEADRIRDDLKARDILLEDRGDETHWRYAN